MKKKVEVAQVFAEDEMELRGVDAHWTAEELLEQQGIFFLKDIVQLLGLDPLKVKRCAKEIHNKGENPWEVLGARKIWNHWIIRMTVFAPYFRRNLVSKVSRISPEWDGNTLLKQKGVYYLTDVCKLIPFSLHQLRYQAKRNPNSKKEFGIWKDEELKVFLVEMERFAPWVNSLWDGNFGRK